MLLVGPTRQRAAPYQLYRPKTLSFQNLQMLSSQKPNSLSLSSLKSRRLLVPWRVRNSASNALH